MNSGIRDLNLACQLGTGRQSWHGMVPLVHNISETKKLVQ